MLCVQRILQCLRRARVGDEALVRRPRRMIPLADHRAVPLFPGKLERRLEEVHEQPHRAVDARQSLGGGQPFEAAISDHAAHDRSVLLFDMRLIVLAVRT